MLKGATFFIFAPMFQDNTIFAPRSIILSGFSFFNTNIRNLGENETNSKIFYTVGQQPRLVRMMKKLEVENLVGLSLQEGISNNFSNLNLRIFVAVGCGKNLKILCILQYLLLVYAKTGCSYNSSFLRCTMYIQLLGTQLTGRSKNAFTFHLKVQQVCFGFYS